MAAISNIGHQYELINGNHGAAQDPRRFTIYFQLNNLNPIKVSNIIIQQYLLLKSNDAYARNYCTQILAPMFNVEPFAIEIIYRSLDGVDFLPIPLAEDAVEDA